MSTIYLPLDVGETFYDSSADECYHRNATNPICHAADTTIGTGDVLGTTGLTFDRDDDNIVSGTTHRTWTACQMCVALYVSGYQGGLVTVDNSATEYTLFTAPSDGVIRIKRPNGDDGANAHLIIINGVTVFTGQVPESDDWKYARAYRLVSGDVVKVRCTDWITGDICRFHSIFCPYVYP